ncbi:amidohydrolase family protein [Rhodoferax sp.]|uniref:amidohydrolase family protein n=1 Tax=Rhodoferax sp. TaxID=50421 RepID=UPI00262C905E|nr:amidohydrolase family protein [Rhodoferax sp.]MDD2925147.1 amidohydrolase family protein [Rhodoferax sp.]
MKIDTHQHYWRYHAADFPWISDTMPALRRDHLPGDSQPAMQVCGVDAVVAVQARCQSDETDFLLALAAQHPYIVGVVGWVDLMQPDLAARLEAWAGQSALCGFRHILQDEPDLAAVIAATSFNDSLRLLQQRQLVYDVLVFGHQLPLAVAVCARHEAHWLVLDHVGKPAVRDWLADASVAQRWRASLRELGAMPHVVCKLSGLVTEADWQHGGGLSAADEGVILTCFDEALAVFGPDRLMFGSDWPVCQLAAAYDAVAGLAQRWAQSRLSRPEQQAFWAGNAVRCYGLPVPTPAQ